MSHYSVQQILRQGQNYKYARAFDHTQEKNIIIKANTSDEATKDLSEALHKEYEILRMFYGSHVARPVSFGVVNGHDAIIFEDDGGEILSDSIDPGPVPWRRALTWASNIADALQDIHSAWVVHRDIGPDSIICNPHTDELRVIDVSIAVQRAPGTPYSADTDVLVGSLPYISPEQTGRIGAPIDHRSDLYSLGATLFQFLTGVVPFASTDPMEIIHAHIARPAPDVTTLNPDVPRIVSALVRKLLEKDPRDRYQSAFGLGVDLRSILARVDGADSQDAVVIGQVDVPTDLRATAQVHGRGDEVTMLRGAHARARHGAFEVVMVAGESGSGKTRLVQEIETAAAASADRFVSAKLDPSARAMPYHPISVVLGKLVSDALGQDEATVSAFRERLTEKLGENAALAVELVPNLTTILASSPDVLDVPVHEAQTRSLLVLRELIHAFAEPDQALVLFFDDLQWADAASLQTLSSVAQDSRMHNLLVIGAYRDNEIHPEHLLNDTMRTMRAAPIAVNTIQLGTLDRDSVVALLSECLHLDGEQVSDLAETCWVKTLGNPFFLTQFLQTLVQETYLYFNQRHGRWEWQHGKIGTIAAADNVIALMVDRLHHLPESAQDALVMTACADSAVDLRTLSKICGKSIAETAKAMTHALAAGLIVATDNETGDTVRPTTDKPYASYRFVHDRIQEAALALLKEGERKPAHLRIGRALLSSLTEPEIEEHVFQLMYHYSWAKDLLVTDKERTSVARLALMASRKAAATGGFGPLFDYAAFGLSLLPENAWSVQYDLTLGLHEQFVFGCYITHQHCGIEATINTVLKNAVTPLDKSRTVEIQIMYFYAQGDPGRSVDIGLDYLKQLGADFPRHPNQQDVIDGLRHVQDLLAGRSVDSLADLPDMTDPIAHSFTRICNALAGPTYTSEPPLFLCMVFKQVEWFVTYGNSADAAVGYSTYAMALCVVAEQYEDGQAFGALAFKLVDRYKAMHLRTRIYLNVYLWVHHWRHHLKETFAPLNEGYRLARRHGDLFFAALHAMVYCHYLFWSGARLSDVEATMAEQHRLILEECGQREQALWVRVFWQTVKNLRMLSDSTVDFVGDVFDETASAAEIRDSKDQVFVFLYHYNKLILAVMFQDEDRIVRHLEPARRLLHSCNGIAIVPVFHFYAFLGRVILMTTDSEPGSDARRDSLDALRDHADAMRVWAENAPMNYGHKHAAMAAVLAGLEGDDTTMAARFDAAITGAERHGYTWDKAVYQELAGHHCLDRGLDNLAGLYLREALRSYVAWGATAKVAHLRRRHGLLLADDGAARSAGDDADVGPREISQHDLDLATVLKASQAIGAEIVLNRLLDRMMRTVLENAGADRGVLLRIGPTGDLNIWAETCVGEPTRADPDMGDTATDGVLPLGLVHHAVATRQTVIYPTTDGHPFFASDAYLADQDIRSAICLPIRARDEVIVLLYLENRITPNAFTRRHVEILELLAGQIAISLENARLYEQLELRVEERTQELQDKMAELSRAYDSVRAIQRKLEAQAIELRQARDRAEEANAELLQKNVTIQKMACTDPLTGLYNRRFLDNALEKEMEREKRYIQPLSMAVIDIDHFKRFNDTFGHACGDRVLQEVASVISRRVRGSDTVARWGGEEFCILMPQTEIEGALTLLEDIRRQIEITRLPDLEETVTISAGVAMLEDADTAESFFQRIDEALYAAKEGGRNQVRLSCPSEEV